MRFNRYLFFLFIIRASFADIPSGAPDPAGRVLIIYNAKGYGYEFSQPAAETFEAALTGDISKLNFPTLGAHPIADSELPKFSPYPQVDMLAITGTNGIYSQLDATYGSIIPDELKGGKELQFWSLVFDVRFDNAGNGGNAASDKITLDNIPTSDINLFKELLNDGGGLFIQGEYNVFKVRNQGVTSVINLFTKGNNFDPTKISSNIFQTITSYPANPENFNTDFNDLNSIPIENQLKLVVGGGYPQTEITGGSPLVEYNNESIIHFWDSKDLTMENGRLMVSFDINGWGDHYADYQNGKVSTGAFATIQNIYDLLGGALNYSVFKEFTPSQGDVGDTASFKITVVNNGIVDISGISVTDTISNCLEIISSTPAASVNGKVYTWNAATIGTIGANDSVEIIVNFYSTQMPPCN